MMIIKFGGHAMKDTHGLFASSINAALSKGEQVIVVHGGGPQINAELAKHGIESTFVNGYRFTTEEMFTVVDDVLTNAVGPEIAKNLKDHGIMAESISGKDASVLFAQEIEGLGKVGKVVRVDVSILEKLLAENIVPVIAPVAADIKSGTGLNINADLAAAAISSVFKNSTLIIMTDVAGIYKSWPNKDSLIADISSHELQALRSSLSEGMLPKVDAALEAVRAGAHSVRIIDGTDVDAFALALEGRGGTLVRS